MKKISSEQLCRVLTAGCLAIAFILPACSRHHYDVIIRNGTVYDGSGMLPQVVDIAINGDKIDTIGVISEKKKGKIEIDAAGLSIAPGFINMLSWANETLIEDGRGMSDILQGVTLQIFGEGWSMGPMNDEMLAARQSDQGDYQYEVGWRTLGEYLTWLEKRGVSMNVASFVGATTIRIYVIGYDDRYATPEELHQMQELVLEAMREGAMGVGTSLIYTPGYYANTAEIIALASAAAEYDGLYTSHIRNEGNAIDEALDEFVEIVRESGIRGEVHHLKMAGIENWPKVDGIIKKIELARAEGLDITANMYNYTAAATSLTAIMPPWSMEGGFREWVKRMEDPEIRARMISEIQTPQNEWENFYLLAGTPDNILLVGFRNDDLKHLTGKTLTEISEIRGTDPLNTVMDLIIEDQSRIGTVYFLMSEENIKRQMALDWMSFGSDSGAFATEGVFLRRNPHPRGYGNFARLLGHYVRDEKVISMEDAIRRLTSLPAENLLLTARGSLKNGYYADIVIFDPETIQDLATFGNPHQYATGVNHVFVNGVQVVRNGKHTGKKPGRFVKGPGYRK